MGYFNLFDGTHTPRTNKIEEPFGVLKNGATVNRKGQTNTKKRDSEEYVEAYIICWNEVILPKDASTIMSFMQSLLGPRLWLFDNLCRE